MLRVAINGAGRIGRGIIRAYFNGRFPDIKIVALKDITSVDNVAYLLKYDSVYGKFNHDVIVSDDSILIGNNRIQILDDRKEGIPDWSDLGVDLVMECTGTMTDAQSASLHIKNGAKYVLISAPCKDADRTVVFGINHSSIDPDNDRIISNASCTTNCIAPILKVIDDELGIEMAQMTTVHSYTNNQTLLDTYHKNDPRRGRAAGLCMIPTSTGVNRALKEVLPEIASRFFALSIRTPVVDVSLIDLVAIVQNNTNADKVNLILEEASESELKGILNITYEPLVSCDLIGNTASAVVDGNLTVVTEERMVKVIAWYDNEFAFCNRMLDVAQYMAEHI